MTELREAAKAGMWIGLTLAFCGQYEHYHQWVPAAWMAPFIVLKVYEKLSGREVA